MDALLSKKDKDIVLLEGDNNIIDRYPKVRRLLESIPTDFELLAKCEDGIIYLTDCFWIGKEEREEDNNDQKMAQLYQKYLKGKEKVITLSSEYLTLARNKVYLKPGDKVPGGVEVEFTPRGKRFYYARSAQSTPERVQEKTVEDLEQENEAQKKVESSPNAPWWIKMQVDLMHPRGDLSVYSRKNKSYEIQNVGSGFAVSEDGKLLGSTPRERDAVLFVQRRFETELRREKAGGIQIPTSGQKKTVEAK